MEFQQIEFGSDEYHQALRLREAVLRAPLGTVLSEQDLAGENQQFHFGAFKDGELIACVSMKPVNSASLELRQMAVAPGFQGDGTGRALVDFAEGNVVENGYRHIELAARRSAIGFYEKLGYGITGEPFVKLGIEHIRLAKTLRGMK